MEHKKRRNRKSDSETVGLKLTNAVNDEQTVQTDKPTAQKNPSPGRGVIAYLKAHLWLVGVICFLALGTLGAGLKYLDDQAQKEIARRNAVKNNLDNNRAESFLNRLNPFLPDPTPTPLQLSKEYLYAGSRLLAVEDANANAAAPADLAVWRPSSGVWWVRKPDGNVQISIGWGQNGDEAVPGDYDGDGKTDFSIYRKGTGGASSVWWIMKSSTGDVSSYAVAWGLETDTPAPADYDGDGKTDIAIYRAGIWYIQQSASGTTIYPAFGTTGDVPAPADFDGDGRADLAVWRNSDTTFYSQNSSNNQALSVNLSASSTAPVPADYDGDGRADYAVRTGANWKILNSSSGQTQTVAWQAGEEAVQNDYDGDGKVDIAVWKDSNGTWYIRQSSQTGTANELRQVQWGQAFDIPVPAFYRR